MTGWYTSHTLEGYVRYAWFIKYESSSLALYQMTACGVVCSGYPACKARQAILLTPHLSREGAPRDARYAGFLPCILHSPCSHLHDPLRTRAGDDIPELAAYARHETKCALHTLHTLRGYVDPTCRVSRVTAACILSFLRHHCLRDMQGRLLVIPQLPGIPAAGHLIKLAHRRDSAFRQVCRICQV